MKSHKKSAMKMWVNIFFKSHGNPSCDIFLHATWGRNFRLSIPVGYITSRHSGRIPLQKKWTCQTTNLKRKREKNIGKPTLNLCLKYATSISVKNRRSVSFIFMFSHQNSPVQSFLSGKNNKTWVDWANVAGLVIQSDLSVMVKVTRNQWLFVTSN